MPPRKKVIGPSGRLILVGGPTWNKLSNVQQSQLLKPKSKKKSPKKKVSRSGPKKSPSRSSKQKYLYHVSLSDDLETEFRLVASFYDVLLVLFEYYGNDADTVKIALELERDQNKNWNTLKINDYVKIKKYLVIRKKKDLIRSQIHPLDLAILDARMDSIGAKTEIFVSKSLTSPVIISNKPLVVRWPAKNETKGGYSLGEGERKKFLERIFGVLDGIDIPSPKKKSQEKPNEINISSNQKYLYIYQRNSQWYDQLEGEVLSSPFEVLRQIIKDYDYWDDEAAISVASEFYLKDQENKYDRSGKINIDHGDIRITRILIPKETRVDPRLDLVETSMIASSMEHLKAKWSVVFSKTKKGLEIVSNKPREVKWYAKEQSDGTYSFGVYNTIEKQIENINFTLTPIKTPKTSSLKKVDAWGNVTRK